ncbi:MAG TPA: hypothetical protein VN695_10130 [Streptosporangiaceae bacterium]|nr:hypothetical protein [Streptosporangiaceae bacterium]
MLLFAMLVSRITQLTRDDVIEDGQATWLAIDGHRLMLPPRLAHLPEAALGHGDAFLCGRFRPWVQR